MKTGMRTLRQSAINKMVQGHSPLSEVIKTTDADSSKKKEIRHSGIVNWSLKMSRTDLGYTMPQLLKALVDQGGSDLHISRSLHLD